MSSNQSSTLYKSQKLWNKVDNSKIDKKRYFHSSFTLNTITCGVMALNKTGGFVAHPKKPSNTLITQKTHLTKQQVFNLKYFQLLTLKRDHTSVFFQKTPTNYLSKETHLI